MQTKEHKVLTSAHRQRGSLLRVEREEALEEILAVGGHVEWHPVLASDDLLAQILKHARNKSHTQVCTV